jgi:hypothetical protein
MKTKITVFFAILAAVAMTGCSTPNSVPRAAMTTASIAGGDWVDYASPKSTAITIEKASITADGVVEISGLSIVAQPDEATVTNTSTVDQKLYDMLGAQSDAMSSVLTSLVSGSSNTTTVIQPAAITSAVVETTTAETE